jgi:putative oxidoreductase
MKKFLRLGFLPTNPDLGLLVLRLVFGLSLLLLHGWGKLMRFPELSEKFADPLGVGHQASLILALVGEVLCPVLLVLGAATRLAALGSGITMGVALFLVHGLKLRGQGNGEDALVYLAAFTVLFLAGGGRYSVDGGGKA